MSALRITAATIARTMLAALPEADRLEVLRDAVQTIRDRDSLVDLVMVARQARLQAEGLVQASQSEVFTRFPPIQGGLK